MPDPTPDSLGALPEVDRPNAEEVEAAARAIAKEAEYTRCLADWPHCPALDDVTDCECRAQARACFDAFARCPSGTLSVVRGERDAALARMEAAEKVCRLLDDCVVRCPCCDAAFTAMTRDHKDRCEWRQWAELAEYDLEDVE